MQKLKRIDGKFGGYRIICIRGGKIRDYRV